MDVNQNAQIDRVAPRDDKPRREDRRDQDHDEAPLRRWHRHPLLVGGLMLLVAAAIIIGVLFWRHSRAYASTDDAYIDVASERVSPRVAGQILRVLVNDNEDVKAGQVLAELDPADFESRLNQALAEQARADSQVAQAEAQKAAAEAQLEQAQANAAVAEANATNTATDRKRYEELRNRDPGFISQQQMDTVTTAAKDAAALLVAARKAVGAAEAQLLQAKSQIHAAQSSRKSAAAQVEQARRNLGYTKIRASVDGRIAMKTVAAGNYAQPGTQLMAVVPREVYVTANFKETQLAHMRRSQPVRIHVDAFPDMELRGRVDSFQPAAGQIFSVLPPQNASGNWVKVVQRVAVKIVLDQIPDDPERRLGPGMSVEVKVAVR